MRGRSTLFPNTADASLFDDPRDREMNELFAAIPKDRAGARPQPERVFGSLPVSPGEGNRFAAATIPGLAKDLHTSYTAWQDGSLEHVNLYLNVLRTAAVLAVTAAGAIAFGMWRRRRTPRP